MAAPDPTKARLINLNLFVFTALLEWVWGLATDYVYNNPGNLTAAVAASVLIRCRFTSLNAFRWFGGVLSGIVFAALTADMVHRTFMHMFEPWQCWGVMGGVGDFLLLLLAGTQKLGQKVGDQIIKNPGDSFRAGIDGVKEVLTLGERAAVLWVKFKTGAAGVVSTIGETIADKLNRTKTDE